MNMIDFLNNCTKNFELDIKTMTIRTPYERELTVIGCGWDEGRRWYFQFHAEKLLNEVENCLIIKKDQSRIMLEGIKYECNYEVDGGIVFDIISGSETEEPKVAEFEIDIYNKQIMFNKLAH